jgi:hypothetical protein
MIAAASLAGAGRVKASFKFRHHPSFLCHLFASISRSKHVGILEVHAQILVQVLLDLRP